MTPSSRARGRCVAPGMLLLLLSACSAAGAGDDPCRIVQPLTQLPAGLEETSGVAVSRAHEGILWTHNDSGGDPEVVAVRANGALVARVAVEGARAVDWEDLALAPCPSGTCLYIADTGEAGSQREEVGVYRLPEPHPVSGAAGGPVEHFPARFPDGPRDAEALFVLPGGEMYLVTKGRSGDVELFRYPPSPRPGQVVTLQHVRTLAVGAQPLEEQVTGASAAPSGEWVAIRSYKRLRIWRTDDLLAGADGPVLTADLAPLGEIQGEAVALLDNGAVVLTSEGGFPGAAGMLGLVECSLESSER